ncbi:MAG: hypothetical protein IPL32_05590 [Chloracidobacterium sp.]|nr:hypothetical protein [Chloracidobacterium sp.]
MILCIAAALCAVAVGQKLPSADAIAASGSFSGQLYTNTALGFTMLAPGGWNFYTADQNSALVARNRENAMMSGDETLKTAAANTQVLFQAMPPPVAGRDLNALFSCGVERLTKPATGEKYIEANKNLVLRRSGVKVTKDIHSIKLGGVNFSAFDVEGSTNKGTYRQRYIATVRKSAALFFVITLYDDKQDVIVEHSLKSISFR